MIRSSRSTNSSWMLEWTSSREPAIQLWPAAAKIPATAPFAASSRSASSNTMLADFPPNSNETRLNDFAAFS